MGLLVAHEAPTGEALLGGFRIVTPKWTPFWGPHYRPGSLERWVAKTQGPAGWPAQSHAAESQRSKECNQAQEPFGQGAAQISEGESFQFTARAHFCANSATFNPILLIVRFFVSPLGVCTLMYQVWDTQFGCLMCCCSIFWVALSQNLLLRFQGIWCQVTRPRGWVGGMWGSQDAVKRRFEVVDRSERGQRSSEALLCIVPSVLTQAAPPVPVPDQAG